MKMDFQRIGNFTTLTRYWCKIKSQTITNVITIHPAENITYQILLPINPTSVEAFHLKGLSTPNGVEEKSRDHQSH